MAIKVLDVERTALRKGNYYAWIRTDRSRAMPGVTIPLDTFLEYSVARCALPTREHRFIKALGKGSFEVRDDFKEIPDDRLYAGGLQAKFDNETGEISKEQMIAERMYREMELGVRADAHAIPGPVRAAMDKADRDAGLMPSDPPSPPENPGLDAAAKEHAAAQVAAAGPQIDGQNALDAALGLSAEAAA